MSLHVANLLQPCLRLLDPEKAHNVTIWALEHGFYKKQKEQENPILQQDLWGMRFDNPVGMAAGFDKDGRVADALLDMGFGFVEVGTVTPKPQEGNEKPRLFRIPEERAVINRMGFNNKGQTAIKKRLENRKQGGIIGVNIGANKLTAEPIEDYVEGLKVLYPLADYFTINISSPNTPGLRGLQAPEKLHALLSLVIATRGAMMESGYSWKPLLVKLAPDIEADDLPAVVECLQVNCVDGIIISNTTVSRDGLADTAIAGQAGGLSGAPLFYKSTHILAKVYQLTKGEIPLVGVGGIDSGEKAIDKILAGASLIQLYTGLVYEGADLIVSIKRDIARYITEHNLQSVTEMVGSQANIWAKNE